MTEDEIRNGLSYGKKLLRFLKKDKGYHLAFDGIIRPKHDQEQLIENFPWIFLNGAGRMKCPLWLSLHFGTFGYIPSYCVDNCWKVVVIPKDIRSLFIVHDHFVKKNYESKVGLDMRPYTFGIYRGFVYCTSRFDAEEIEKKLLIFFSDEHFEVFKKRGCTEFENKQDSRSWQAGPEQRDFEQILEYSVNHNSSMRHITADENVKEPSFEQPDWVKHLIRLYWTQSAYASGDHTWKYSPYKKFIQISKTPVKY